MQNKSLFNSLVIVSLIAFSAASETFPSLNESLQLVPFKDEVIIIFLIFQFRIKLLTTMVLDFGLAWAVEMITLTLFSDNRAKAELFPQ
jgi:cation-transporting ATPase 13A1